jgi:hypothetical protein
MSDPKNRLLAEWKSTEAKLDAGEVLLRALQELVDEAFVSMTGGKGHLIDNAHAAIDKAKAAGMTPAEGEEYV